MACAEEVRGIVIKADAEKNELVIEGRGRGVRGVPLRFRLDKETQILAGRKPATMADLITGKRVRVVYEEQQGQRKALLLTLPAISLNLAGPAPTLPVATDPDAIAGVLRRVAFTDREIVVISSGSRAEAEREITLPISEDVKVSRDQKAIRFDDLKEGESVLIHTEKRDGQLLAKSIQVGAQAGGPAPAKDDRKIDRLRQVLKMLDGYLQMMDRK
jgi:hypothetical protein